MAYPPNWLDRLRIERVVWTLDTLLTIVPGKRRRAIRRETRANLRAASADVGTAEAIRRLGDLRPLAVRYTEAYYGEQRRRPSVWGALIWSQLAALALAVVIVSGLESFLDGVEAAGSARGTHDWTTLSPVVSGHVEYDTSGRLSGFGYEISAWFLLVYVLVALILGGRLWRLVLWRPARISPASDGTRR